MYISWNCSTNLEKEVDREINAASPLIPGNFNEILTERWYDCFLITFQECRECYMAEFHPGQASKIALNSTYMNMVV